jgi:NAD(P)-dependent dehydrogenase (short-subunit alcohol dehydrogenase family)
VAAETVVEEIRGFGAHALASKADLSDEARIAAMLQLPRQEFGTFDILAAKARRVRACPDAPVGA